MSQNSKIEWTDATWNPVTGCTKVSQGCKNCYAERMFERFNGKDSFRHVQTKPERLLQPLKWKGPKKVFVNSMSDLFHEAVPFEFIDQVFAIMAMCPDITFQVLTKRAERMEEYFNRLNTQSRIMTECDSFGDDDEKLFNRAVKGAVRAWTRWPLSNVWLGVSIEDQQTANARIPSLLKVPAVIRFISCEPLLGPVDLYEFSASLPSDKNHPWRGMPILYGIHWVIAGGESGPKSRPVHPDWIRSLRDQCASVNVPFFFKQWGEFGTKWFDINTKEPVFKMYNSHLILTQKDWVYKGDKLVSIDGTRGETLGAFKDCAYPVAIMNRVGKQKSGNVLDGNIYEEFPTP